MVDIFQYVFWHSFSISMIDHPILDCPLVNQTSPIKTLFSSIRSIPLINMIGSFPASGVENIHIHYHQSGFCHILPILIPTCLYGYIHHTTNPKMQLFDFCFKTIYLPISQRQIVFAYKRKLPDEVMKKKIMKKIYKNFS